MRGMLGKQGPTSIHRVCPKQDETNGALGGKFPCCKSVTWAWYLFLLLLHYLWSQSTTGHKKKKETKQQHGRKPNSYDSTQLTENITSYDKSDVNAMLTSTGLTVTILKAWSWPYHTHFLTLPLTRFQVSERTVYRHSVTKEVLT